MSSYVILCQIIYKFASVHSSKPVIMVILCHSMSPISLVCILCHSMSHIFCCYVQVEITSMYVYMYVCVYMYARMHTAVLVLVCVYVILFCVLLLIIYKMKSLVTDKQQGAVLESHFIAAGTNSEGSVYLSYISMPHKLWSPFARARTNSPVLLKRLNRHNSDNSSHSTKLP
jgi:hypothetical protein